MKARMVTVVIIPERVVIQVTTEEKPVQEVWEKDDCGNIGLVEGNFDRDVCLIGEERLLNALVDIVNPAEKVMEAMNIEPLSKEGGDAEEHF